MSSKSFVKILRKVIREEVRAAVKEILTEQKVNHKKVINHGMDMHAMSEGITNKPKRKFTKNSMLNDLLNETAATPASQEQLDWSTMNFKSEMAESFGNLRKPQPLATTGINGEAINMNNENVAKTVDIMTRDYSGLMKAIEKKKGK
jgi:hypothetical protein